MDIPPFMIEANEVLLHPNKEKGSLIEVDGIVVTDGGFRYEIQDPNRDALATAGDEIARKLSKTTPENWISDPKYLLDGKQMGLLGCYEVQLTNDTLSVLLGDVRAKSETDTPTYLVEDLKKAVENTVQKRKN